MNLYINVTVEKSVDFFQTSKVFLFLNAIKCNELNVPVLCYVQLLLDGNKIRLFLI